MIVLVTMAVALAAGAGFFGDGMMFPNQAAASAVLVVTLHRHGTGAERAARRARRRRRGARDRGASLFPAQPLSLLRDAERRRAAHAGPAAGRGRRRSCSPGGCPSPTGRLPPATRSTSGLSALARARATARLNVRVAPRRFPQRAAVDAENRRTAQLDLLANAVHQPDPLGHAAGPAPTPLPQRAS